MDIQAGIYNIYHPIDKYLRIDGYPGRDIYHLIGIYQRIDGYPGRDIYHPINIYQRIDGYPLIQAGIYIIQ